MYQYIKHHTLMSGGFSATYRCVTTCIQVCCCVQEFSQKKVLLYSNNVLEEILII